MAMLTKSNYLLGLQCPKLLWVAKNDKERIPKPTEIEQKKFDDGTLVGELATQVFPNGTDLSKLGFKENIDKTKEAIKNKEIIYEAGFLEDNLFSRADILNPVGDEWDIIEVKSATKVKDINLHDVAFQKYVYEKAGLKIRKCFLMHINNEYVKNGEIEPSELFVQTDITEKIEEFSENLRSNIEKMFKVIEGEEPEFCIDDILTIEYGNICLDDFMDSLPENNIFEFYRMLKKKIVELYKEGCKCMDDVPESVKLNEKQAIQKRLCCDGGVHINKQGINNFLRNLEYPIYYLDFETINPILPKFEGMKSYQRIPFQFSLHIQKQKGGELKHISFLADGTSDPRPKFMQSLKDNLGNKGSVLVYNQGFEKGVMNECATAFPEFRKWYDEVILHRIKDLWDVFRNFDYYDPKQKGSCSIKYVLPVMSDLSYKDLEHVKKGDQASFEWERVTYNEIDYKEKQKIRDALEKYCCLDTLAEVKILDKLYEVV
ncbi:MAG: DUF2779 domain-containing protein [Candidatus Pacearchaeota archaeon]